MKTEEIIEHSVLEVKKMGIKIVRGPLFVWGKSLEVPEACDCLGAVLIAHKKAKPDFPPGWIQDLNSILGKDTYWWWRFDYGFNQLRTLELYEEIGSKREYIKDDVSHAGYRLAKKLGLSK